MYSNVWGCLRESVGFKDVPGCSAPTVILTSRNISTACLMIWMPVHNTGKENTFRRLYVTLMDAVYTNWDGNYRSVTSAFIKPILSSHIWDPAQLIWSPDDEDGMHICDEKQFSFFAVLSFPVSLLWLIIKRNLRIKDFHSQFHSFHVTAQSLDLNQTT